MSPEVFVDETIIRRHGFWRRPLRLDRIRRVHWYTEQDGRRALVFRGSGLRLVAVPDDVLVDPDVHSRITALVERLRQRGVRVEADTSSFDHGVLLLRSATMDRTLGINSRP
jgi:hypothetical protein